MNGTKWSFEASGVYKRVLEHCRKANKFQSPFEREIKFDLIEIQCIGYDINYNTYLFLRLALYAYPSQLFFLDVYIKFYH